MKRVGRWRGDVWNWGERISESFWEWRSVFIREVFWGSLEEFRFLVYFDCYSISIELWDNLVWLGLGFC